MAFRFLILSMWPCWRDESRSSSLTHLSSFAYSAAKGGICERTREANNGRRFGGAFLVGSAFAISFSAKEGGN